MKKNVSMFARLLPVILVIAISTTACKTRPRWGTVLPGRTGNVSDEGLRPTNPRTGGPGDLGVAPIRPGGDGSGLSPIQPVTDGGVVSDPTGSGLDPFGPDRVNRDESKFAAQTVYFDFDKYTIKPNEIEKIKTVAAHLKANTTHLMEIDGHCDERGTEEYNRSLGEKRAQSIREYLVREGVGAERIRTISFGEDKPVDPGHDETAWSKNRRGDFVLLTPK
jgi:peptidoglycan-associated lipoprotein